MRHPLAAVLTLVAVFIGARLIMAQTQPVAPKQETFAILYEPGPTWVKGREIFDQDLRAHGEYMAKLLADGHLVLGGPFTDSSGGLAIVTATDAIAAAAIVKNDPAVTTGVFKATLRPWYVVFRKPGGP